MFIYKSFYEKQNLQNIIVVQMDEIVKIQMHFQLIYLIYFFNRCVDFGKIFKNEIYFFSFGQRMMWNNVVNLSHILCQQV